MSAQWPTEHMATVAVDAAAEVLYRATCAKVDTDPRSWDTLAATDKLAFRDAALPTVWAALSALPDPRPAVRAEAHDYFCDWPTGPLECRYPGHEEWR